MHVVCADDLIMSLSTGAETFPLFWVRLTRLQLNRELKVSSFMHFSFPGTGHWEEVTPKALCMLSKSSAS